MSIPDPAIHAVRCAVRCALQEAADLFKQNNDDEAYRVIDEKVGNLYRDRKITTAHLDTVYRTIVHDPLLNPQTPFSKRQYVPVIALKGTALRDLVQFYSASDDPIFLKEGPVKRGFLQAAELFEKGEEEAACKLIHENLAHPSEIHEEVMKEVLQIVRDDFREPVSLFLKRHVAGNPIVDPNRLRAKALECLSMHLFDEDERPGARSLPALPKLPERLVSGGVLGFSNADDLAVMAKTSKGTIADLQKSLKSRKKASLEELRDWRKMGIVVSREAFPALRSVKGRLQTKDDMSDLLKFLDHKLEEIDLDAANAQRIGTDFPIWEVGQRCPNLLKFSLRNFSQKIDISPLVQGCRNIQTLVLRGTNVPSFSFKLIAENCPFLTHIDVWNIDTTDMPIFVEKCKQLSHVAISFERNYFPNNKQDVALCEGVAALAKCKTLSHLELVNCNLTRKNYNILSLFQAGIAPLRSIVLDVEHISELDTAFENRKNPYNPFAQGCPGLESLTINNSWSPGIFPDTLLPFSQYCPNITTLEFTNHNVRNNLEEGVKAILQNGRRINRFSLNLNFFSDELYALLASSNCQIMQLDIPFRMVAQFEVVVSPANDLIAFVRKNPWLTHLNLRNHRGVNDEVLATLSTMLPHLISADLSGTEATHAGIAAFGAGCPKLRILKVSSLKYLRSQNKGCGDLLLKAISDNFPKLVHLDLSCNWDYQENDPFTDKGLTCLGKGCPLLEQLDVSSNNLRGPELKAIANSFFNLRVLNNTDNQDLPPIYREKMVKNSPKVEVLPMPEENPQKSYVSKISKILDARCIDLRQAKQ